jgi:uncharacterized SAM-binding protein YcdF (DUF218 family)
VIVAPVLLGWAAAAAAIDAIGSRPAPGAEHDAIVVLGCRVMPSGAASPALARRAVHAAELWREGRAPLLVVTGGVGDHPPSEARAAAEIARRRGVPEHAIVLEEASTSTEENARFARALVGARRVLLVTDGFHALRASRIFARHFDEVAVAPVTAGPYGRTRGALREVPLLALELARDHLR